MMARSRNIREKFLEDEDLADLGAHHQLTVAVLPMYADKAGRMEDRPRRIRGNIFRQDHTVDMEKILADLADLPDAGI
jgi:hypothetical protein